MSDQHKYSLNELNLMDLDELRLVALMVGVVFRLDTGKSDLVQLILTKQDPWPWGNVTGPGA